MDIYITPEGGSRVHLPMLPEEVKLGAEAKFQSYGIISLGDVKVPRGKGMEEISWPGILPGEKRKKASYVKDWKSPDSFIKLFERWRDKGTRCNILITGTAINHSVYISKFDGKYVGGMGDFKYEIKFIASPVIQIYTIQETTAKNPVKNSKKNATKPKRTASKKSSKKSSTSSKTKSYTIRSGDTLSRIALKELKKASRYTEIYNLNKNTIEAAAKKHGKKSSNNGHWIYPGTKLKLPKK